MNTTCEWLNHKLFVFLSPLRFSWFSGISLKGINSLIENNEIDFVCVEKKILIPVPIWKYSPSSNLDASIKPGEVQWKEHDSNVPY